MLSRATISFTKNTFETISRLGRDARVISRIVAVFPTFVLPSFFGRGRGSDATQAPIGAACTIFPSQKMWNPNARSL